MSFKTSETTVGSAVATNGTFTVSYPANTNAGTFAAYGHKLWVDKFQRLLSSPSDFTISFGASYATITYLGSTSIPAGARVNAQLNIVGTDNGELKTDLEESEVKRADLANMVRVNFGAPITADADGYFASQDLTSAGVASVSVTAAAAIAAAALAGTADVPRNVVAAWTGTAVITITGTDEYGNVVVEKSGSGTSLTGKKAFKTVTGISVSANVTSLTVGTGDVLGLPMYVGSKNQVLLELQDGVERPRKPGYIRVSFSILEAEADAGTIAYICPGIAGTIVDAGVAVGDTVTTGGALDFSVGTTAVDGLVLTIADGATAGVVYTDTPTLGHASTAVLATDYIKITPASAINASGRLVGWIGIQPTTLLDGTLVVGVDSAATATTGDVRGTYDPAAACNGTKVFDLVVRTEDPKYLGVAQYEG